MKVQYISDIHTEFLDPVLQIPVVVNKIRNGVPDAQVLVLGGDIGAYYKFENLEAFLNLICPRYQYVIYIKGNHEYYSNKATTTIDEVVKAYVNLQATIPNFYLLDNSDICIEGKNIIGTSLWFDISHPEATLYSMYLNDFKLIPGGGKSLSMMSDAAYDYVQSLPETYHSTVDLLLCHHGVAPVFHPRFATSPNNVFFYRDITDVIQKLDVRHIIQGHQHHNHYYDLPTNIAVNPEQRVGVHMNCKGYPSEHPPDFSYSKYLEL